MDKWAVLGIAAAVGGLGVAYLAYKQVEKDGAIVDQIDAQMDILNGYIDQYQAGYRELDGKVNAYNRNEQYLGRNVTPEWLNEEDQEQLVLEGQMRETANNLATLLEGY